MDEFKIGDIVYMDCIPNMIYGVIEGFTNDGKSVDVNVKRLSTSKTHCGIHSISKIKLADIDHKDLRILDLISQQLFDKPLSGLSVDNVKNVEMVYEEYVSFLLDKISIQSKFKHVFEYAKQGGN